MEKIEAIREIVSECPDITELNAAITDADINVDWTAETPTDYGVMVYGDNAATEKKYIGGTTEGTYVFNTALFVRLPTEAQYNLLQNSKFFEKFTRYIRKLNQSGVFPALEDGETVTKIETAQGQFYGPDDNGSGLYSIQINMTYTQTQALPDVTGIPKGHSIFYNAE